MATATQLAPPRAVFFDANGAPLAGGFVHAYVAGGGTTLKTTWQDAAETIPNSNPIVLDGSGSCLLYGAGSYTLAVTDATGNAVPGYSGLSTSPITVSPVMSPVINAVTAQSALELLGGVASFATAALMRANLATFDADSPVILSGYYARADGGGGVFLRNASDTTTADNGGTILVDAAGQRWYRAVSASHYNVHWFGAKGDGATNDTTAIQACITAAGAGATVFEAKTYRITGTLTLPVSGSNLRGAGMYATVLLFPNGAANCIQAIGTAPAAYLNANAVRDLSVTGSAKTGGAAIVFQFCTNLMVERVYFNTVWNGIELYVINTATVRNCTMAGVTNPTGYGIYYHAPGDGTYRCDELNLHDVVVNPLYSGAVGLLIDGWANTVNAWQYVALDVSIGIRVLNTSASASHYPTYGEFINSVVDGASVRSVEINAGQVWRFTGCEIGNNSGSSGQGSADTQAFYVAADTGHSETSQIYVVNSNIGGCKNSAADVAAHDVLFSGCTFYQGITNPANTYPAVKISAPANDTVMIGCRNSYFGAPAAWSYGIEMAAGTFRTLVVGCLFNVGSATAGVHDLSGDQNTFSNNYIGPPASGPGPVVTFPRYPGAPSNPITGETYFDTALAKLRTWDGAAWQILW